MRILYTDSIDQSHQEILGRYQIILKETELIDEDVILAQEGCIAYYKKINDKYKFTIKTKNGQTTKVYETIFEYLENHQYYKKQKILGLSPYYDQKDVVEFDNHFWKFITSQPFFQKIMESNIWIKNYMTSIANSGMFFRLPRNKRQRTYWNPPLNAGLPMIDKARKGFLREITFFCHDIGHFLLPDLVYTGTNDPLDKQIYCIYRLLGEATTLPVNEMYLVQSYERNSEVLKMDPNWTRDLPFLLFEEIKDNANIEEVLWASVYFFVKGDWSKFKDLLDKSNGNHKCLDEFGERYEEVNKRGVEWTCDNFDNMYQNRQYYKEWWEYVKNYCDDIGMVTLDEMRERVRNEDDKVDALYTIVLPKIISQFGKNELEDPRKRNYMAFKKWFVGNCLVFFKYGFFDQVKNVLDKIFGALDILKNNNFKYYGNILNVLKLLYFNALQIGLVTNKIDRDDYFTFQGTYPMIDNNVLDENYDKRTLREYLIDYELLDISIEI